MKDYNAPLIAELRKTLSPQGTMTLQQEGPKTARVTFTNADGERIAQRFPLVLDADGECDCEKTAKKCAKLVAGEPDKPRKKPGPKPKDEKQEPKADGKPDESGRSGAGASLSQGSNV